MSQRLVFLLLISIAGLLPVQAAARCRRPPPDPPGVVDLSLHHPTDVDVEIYPFTKAKPDITPYLTGAKPAGAVVESGRSAPVRPSSQTNAVDAFATEPAKPQLATSADAHQGGGGVPGNLSASQAAVPNVKGGAASSDADGNDPPDPAQPKQRMPTVKLADATPAYAQKTSRPTQAAMEPSQTYRVSAGETLRTALTRWISGSGWELVWDAPNDYSLSAAAEFNGGITQAVTQLMESLRVNGASFGADVWQGNQVIRVTRNR